jgi:hypothetical protein
VRVNKKKKTSAQMTCKLLIMLVKLSFTVVQWLSIYLVRASTLKKHKICC